MWGSIMSSYTVPCPMCGGYDTQYVDLRDVNGKVSVMCWGSCGMDFDVNGIWFMLNREEVKK
tara:strand:- start:2310 stop:2495 length:186 start_codon:yes stop_codon:yes gene_type:complete